MFPIRDDAPRSTTPYVNYFLIGLNFAIFIFELSLGTRSQRYFEMEFALVPHNIEGWAQGVVPAAYAFIPIFTSMFLHASWGHVIFNMWGLYIFGDNVEDRLGHFGYLLFYLASGLGAAFTHLLFNLNSQVPTVGASGAIAGVMGAYFLLYPRARVLVWFFFITTLTIVFTVVAIIIDILIRNCKMQRGRHILPLLLPGADQVVVNTIIITLVWRLSFEGLRNH